MSYAVGVDVPVSQMPAGMAFDGGGSSGNNFLGSIGSGLLRGVSSGLDGLFSGSGGQTQGGYGSSSTPYVDDSKRVMQALMAKAIESFDPSRVGPVI